jgi:RimJ/RimL family protein N-acetyltransferase
MELSIHLMSHQYPRLETERLMLRAFTIVDAPRVQLLAGDKQIAATTALIPHPYPKGEAERWISTHTKSFEDGRGATCAVMRREEGLLVGAIALEFHSKHQRAEVGYWIGREYWGNGYATEALKAMIAYGFSRGVNRIWAECFATNPASGRVMQKAAMRHEGTLRQHMVKWGVPVDCEVYGILSSEWQGN